MTAIAVQHHEPGTVAWLDSRRYAVGGSEIAAILGLAPETWDSRFSLWHKKKGLVGPSESLPEMEWGNRLEPAVMAKFLELHPEYTSLGTGTFVHSDRRWQTATPDDRLSLVGNSPDAILECKTSPMGEGWGEAGTDQIPIYYRCQVLWYLDVLGLSKAHVIVLISGYDYREYTVELDDEARADIDILRAAGQEFIDSLINYIRPNIDQHQQTLQVVRELHPEIDPENVEIAPGLAGEYMASAIALKEAEQDLTGWKSRVLDAMGRAKNACVDGERFAYRSARKRGDGTPGTPYLTTDKKSLKRLTAVPSIKGKS